MGFKELGLSCYGPATFAKTPMVDIDGDWQADFAVVGVPFDLGVGFRPGTRWGSKAIRDWSVRFCCLGTSNPGYWDPRSRSDRATCRILDCGDVDMLPLHWEENFDRITDWVSKIRTHKAVPIVLGGDHSITFPVLRAYDGHEPMTVVHFDAHIDYRDEAMGVRYGHGNVIRRVRELPWIERVVSIGIRSLRTREVDFNAHVADGNGMILAWDVHEHGVDYFEDLLPKDRPVYITFDIDGMDAAIAPGTGTPEVGGLTYEQARRFLDIVCGRNEITGFDLVELNPNYDPTNITALLASQIIVETIGFVHANR